jgi:mRNA degradation ribonuclease J1/J2
LTKLQKIGEKEVTMLISDSYWSNKQIFNKSDKEINDSLAKSFNVQNQGKTIAVLEPSAISRIASIIDFARQNEKTVMMASKELIEYYKDAEDLGIINGK